MSAVKVVNAQTLTIEVPAAEAGTVDILVVNADGQSSTFTGGFTYYSRAPDTAPAPVLASITPNTGPSTGGTYALVAGSGFQQEALQCARTVGLGPAELRAVMYDLPYPSNGQRQRQRDPKPDCRFAEAAVRVADDARGDLHRPLHVATVPR